MDFTTIIVSIFTGCIVTIISALFGKWLSRDSANKAIDMSFDKANDLIIQQNFLRVASIFKSAFIKSREIVITEESHNISTYDNLVSEFPKQKRAIIIFEIYLPQNRRTGLWKAWKEYRRDNDAEFSDIYFTRRQIEGYEDPEFNKKNLVLEKVDNILHFTDPNFVFCK